MVVVQAKGKVLVGYGIEKKPLSNLWEINSTSEGINLSWVRILHSNCLPVLASDGIYLLLIYQAVEGFRKHTHMDFHVCFLYECFAPCVHMYLSFPFSWLDHFFIRGFSTVYAESKNNSLDSHSKMIWLLSVLLPTIILVEMVTSAGLKRQNLYWNWLATNVHIQGHWSLMQYFRTHDINAMYLK